MADESAAAKPRKPRAPLQSESETRRAMEREPGPSRVPRYWRPRIRQDCEQGARPCPFVGCRHHLWLDVLHGGGIRCVGGMEIGDLQAMPETCALDVAAAGPSRRVEVARLLRVTSEAVRIAEQGAGERMLDDPVYRDAVRRG